MSRLRFLLPVLLLLPLAAQYPRPPHETSEERDARLPDGRDRKEAIAKEAYQASLDDSKKLVALADELKAELEKNDRYVVSMTAIKKTEEIEKLAKRIRGRLKD